MATKLDSSTAHDWTLTGIADRLDQTARTRDLDSSDDNDWTGAANDTAPRLAMPPTLQGQTLLIWCVVILLVLVIIDTVMLFDLWSTLQHVHDIICRITGCGTL